MKRLFQRWRPAVVLIGAACLIAGGWAQEQVPAAPLSEDKVEKLLSVDPPKRVGVIALQHRINFAIDRSVEDRLRQAGATDELIETLKGVAPKAPAESPAQPAMVSPVPGGSPVTALPIPKTDSLTIRPEAKPTTALESDLEAKKAFLNAQTALQAKEKEQALTLFGRAARLKPDWSDPLLERAKLEANFGRYTETIEDCNEVLHLSPNNAVALNFRGYAYFYTNRLEDALNDLNAAIRADPSYAEAYTNRGDVWWGLREKDKANQDYAKAKQLKNARR